MLERVLNKGKRLKHIVGCVTVLCGLLARIH